MNTPKISIVIPVYNVEDYIGYTMESILNQTLKDIEVILIDDGSSDRSKEIIEDYSKKYSNIKVIHQENSGPSKARNRGISEAKGEFIVFVDSDDLLPEDSLEVRYKTAMEENADLIIGGTLKFNSEKKWPMEKHFLGDGQKDIKDDSSILWTVGPCNKMFKRDLIKDLIFPEKIKYAEDQVFVLEAYLKANKIYTVNRPIYLYRMRENTSNVSLTQQIYNDSSNVLRQILEVWNIACQNIDKYVQEESVRNQIKSRYMDRLANADIWPALKSAMLSNNDKWQKDALEYFIEIIKTLNNEVLKEQSKLKWIIHRLITCKYIFVDDVNYRLLENLVNILYDRFGIEGVYDLYRTTTNMMSKDSINSNPEKVRNAMKSTLEFTKIIFTNMEKYTNNKMLLNDIESDYIAQVSINCIWPVLKKSIISRNKKWQEETLRNSIDFIRYIDTDVLNKQDKLIWIMSKGITDKFLFVDKVNRKLVVELLVVLFGKLNNEAIYKLKKEHGYYVDCINRVTNTKSTIYIYEFLIRRRLKKSKGNIKKKVNNMMNTICSKGVFRVSKILPVKKNSIILATNRSDKLEENIKFINENISQYEGLDVKLYLNKNNRKKRELAKMYYEFARAKVIVLDDYYRQIYGLKFKPKTEVVQVWHACGAFKKFGMSAVGKKDSNSEAFEKMAHGHYTKVITSSKHINEHYADAFNVDIDKVVSLGVPRTDIILDKEYNEFIRTKLESLYPQIKNKKIITYAPTFRGNPKQRKNFRCELDYKKILDTLGEEYVIILKLHPIVNEKSVVIEDEYKDNVLNLTIYKEINDILIITDVLISDYSSVIFEYSLLDRPMIFFAYDLDEYIDERNFYYNYEDLVPGPIVKTNEEIVELIDSNNFDKEKVKAFREAFFDYIDTNSTKRFVKFILDTIDKSIYKG